MRTKAYTVILLLIGLTAPAHSQPDGEPYIVDLTAVDYAFAMPSEIKSGWVTFDFNNIGEEMHFGMILKFNDTVTQEGFNSFNENPTSENFQKYIKETPTVVGGPGFHAGGQSSETTLHLEPGSYLMICNTSTKEGKSHTSLGMEKFFSVSGDKSDALEPEATLNLTLHKYYLESQGSLQKGRQTISIDHEGGSMFDMHLVKLEGASTIPATLNFMDHLREPTNVLFAGGAEQKMVDEKTYVTIDFKPGDYAWVSHEYGAMGMLKEFSIPENDKRVNLNTPDRNPQVIDVMVSSGHIQLPSQIQAGPVTFKLNDENPDMDHDIRMYRAEPGTNVDDYITFREKEQKMREADDRTMTLSNPSSGYFTSFDDENENGEKKLQLSLKPGTYGVVCFHRDQNNNWTHVLNGEAADFTVE